MATPDKRDRLVAAAKELIYQHGFARITLAAVAECAQVPLGNVYYYFRTKEALLAAVIQAHQQEVQALFAQWEQLPGPRERLLALITVERQSSEYLVRYGCPYGSLCQELDKDEGPQTQAAAELLHAYLAWAERQFRLLGTDADEAKDLALDFIASWQGTLLLSASFRSAELLDRRLRRLQTWIETCGGDGQPSGATRQ
jgi:TetR/AcrR family transcriptional regulator, transcriptional repressor for nem operon